MDTRSSYPLSAADIDLQEWKEIEEEDDNMLVKLQRPHLRRAFLDYLQDHVSDIHGIVSHHLSLNKHQQCKVSDRVEWLFGDFNACIPISVTNWREQRVLLRCPFPHMFESLHGPEEKVRCEAATFAWISQNCPRIPIPHLWGFGLPNGLTFRPTAHLPLHQRCIQYIERVWAWICRRPYHTPFYPGRNSPSLKSGYLLVDFIEKEQGTMLSNVWPPDTEEKKRNFFRSLSRVMLGLARCPLPKIGSFTIHDTGEMSLSNRPLTARLALFECEGISTDIPRDRCYSATDSYARDLLNCHDLKLMHQPNAVRDKYDAEGQMAVLTTLRASLSHFIQSDLRHGPFRYIWTDPHPSNIFVDQHYDITSLPDLEWFCALPLEELHPPFWLSGYAVDELDGENRKYYDEMCIDFLDIFEREDSQYSTLGSGLFTKALRSTLQKSKHWFWAALNQPRATYDLFINHLQPQFAPEQLEEDGPIQFQRVLAPYWIEDATEFIRRKLRDKEEYLITLRSQYRKMDC